MSSLLRFAVVASVVALLTASVVGVLDARRHREAECEWRLAIVALADKQAFALITAATPTDPTPEQQARFDRVVADYLALLDEAYDPLLRGCT